MLKVVFVCRDCKDDFDMHDNHKEGIFETLNEAMKHIIETGHELQMEADEPNYRLERD